MRSALNALDEREEKVMFYGVGGTILLVVLILFLMGRL